MPDFRLQSSLKRIDDDRIRIEFTYEKSCLPEFVALAHAAKDVTKIGMDVFMQLYGELVEQARAGDFLILPDDPRVKAHRREHGVDNCIQFMTGAGFFRGDVHMYSLTSLMFSLFGAPGALDVLDMQLKSFLAARAEVEETPQERGTRVAEDCLEMLAELDAARPPPTPPKARVLKDPRTREAGASTQ